VLSTMRFAHEIRPVKDLELPKAGEGWSKKEMDLARQLIDTLAGKWDPTQFRDTYTEVLREIVEAKAEGKDVALPGAPRRPKVANLMKALQASLKHGGARKAPAKAAARGRSAARRRPARRAA
jgi:DNA end-binding protein Ku